MGFHIRGGEGWIRLIRNSPHYGGSGVLSSPGGPRALGRELLHGTGGRSRVHRADAPPDEICHPKDNDAFGLVQSEMFGREVWAYSGEDLDTSTYMARFPAERLTLICLSNMPNGDADGMGRKVLEMLNAAGVI